MLRGEILCAVDLPGHSDEGIERAGCGTWLKPVEDFGFRVQDGTVEDAVEEY